MSPILSSLSHLPSKRFRFICQGTAGAYVYALTKIGLWSEPVDVRLWTLERGNSCVHPPVPTALSSRSRIAPRFQVNTSPQSVKQSLNACMYVRGHGAPPSFSDSERRWLRKRDMGARDDQQKNTTLAIMSASHIATVVETL
jgi:hypothetical protein